MTERRGLLARVPRQRRVQWAWRAVNALALLALLAFALR